MTAHCQVYEWKDAPAGASGEIYISALRYGQAAKNYMNEPVPAGRAVVPLPGAFIRFYPEGYDPQQQPAIDKQDRESMLLEVSTKDTLPDTNAQTVLQHARTALTGTLSSLSKDATITPVEPGKTWEINDRTVRYLARRDGGTITIYRISLFESVTTVETESDGKFYYRITTSPATITSAVRIKKKGYNTLFRTFRHPGGAEYEITAFLVRAKDSKEGNGSIPPEAPVPRPREK